MFHILSQGLASQGTICLQLLKTLFGALSDK